MKKIFFSLVALAALAACSKSEIAYEQTGEIMLAPVTSNTTKSVAGYNGDTFDGIFPTAIDLYVFANAGAPGSAANAHTEPYFKNALFEWTTAKNESTIDNVVAGGSYAGNPERYWPNVKTLVFAGYSDACGVAKTNTMNFAADVLTINSYTQDNANYTEEGTNDLMWFPCTTPYSKQANEIVAQMKHACSWITINVKGDDVTATYEEGNPAVTHTGWTLKSLVVKNLAHTGKAECGASAASWGTLSDYTDEDYYNASTTFTKENAKYEKTPNNFIVIPQTPTTLEVTYSYVSDAANSITFTEKKVINLDYDGEDGENAAWQSGVHYIYNLTITATEILIDPVVETWTPGTTTNVTI